MSGANNHAEPTAGDGAAVGVSPADIDQGERGVPQPAREAAPVEILASIAGQVTFATHQNDIPVIADLALRNNAAESLENLQLRLTCEPPIVAGRTWQIDRLAAEGEIRLKDRKVSLAGGMLSALTERRRADLSLRLEKGDEVLATWRQELIGLAHNEWGGGNTMPELLAAFVMPNDPAISNVLKEAGEVLRRAGKQPSLDGYQSRSRQRTWQIASAMWSAVAARRLVYVEPPASFERRGQKIRTPRDVWNSGLATCLDTTVLFAASLEQAGLHPIIIFTKGHSLCGLWLQPQELPSLICDDCTELRKYEALKELVVFETTLVTNEPPAKFSRAVEAGSRRISEPFEEDFIYGLDIRRARQQQITPLSVVLERKDGVATHDVVIEGLEDAPTLPGFDLGIDGAAKPDTPETRLDHWKRKLLDLTKRNRLLNLKPSSTAIKLLCPDPAALEDKLAGGKKITVRPLAKLTDRGGERDVDLLQHRLGSDFAKTFAAEALERNEVVSDMEEKDLDAGLVQLYRKAKSDLEEGGANTLFLALGVLKWKESPDEERSYRAPIILVPVTLERRSAASKVKIAHHEDEPALNMTLLEMLRQDFDLRLSELEVELPKDDFGVDVTRIWEIVRKAVRDVPGFEVIEEVILSTFSFAKYLMWKDLSDRTEALKESPFVRHLIDNPRDPYGASAKFLRPEEIDEKLDPAELFMPLPADSSQIVAVHASTAGGDFVLEGPPGTGKSQTIANIIAHNLGLGRRVLFVSEKMAALEVVYRRLVDKGLGNFCLELHSSKANKRNVLNQLGMSWHGRQEHARKAWQAEAERLKGLRDDLNRLVKALHRPGVTGVSPRAAIGRAIRFQSLHRLRLSWEGGLEADRARDQAGLQHLEGIAARLGQVYGEISPGEKRAFSKLHQVDWSNAWQARFVEESRTLIERIDALLSLSTRFAHETRLPDPGGSLPHLLGSATIAAGFPMAAQRNLGFALGGSGGIDLENLEKALTALEAYREEKKKLSQDYGDAAIAEAPIDDWQQRWLASQQKMWPFGGLARRRIARRIRVACNLGGRPTSGSDLVHLATLQKLKDDMERAASELSAEAPWRGLDSDVERAREAIKAVVRLREGLARLARDPAGLIEAREVLRRMCTEGQDLLRLGMPLADTAAALVRELVALTGALEGYCREAKAEKETVVDLHELREQAQAVLDLQPRINTWCRWQAVRREAEASGLSDLIVALENGSVEADKAEETFKTAYCLWIAGRLIDERTELRTFSALAHDEKIKAFRLLDQKLADLSIDYIKAKLSGDVPSPDDPDRPPAYGVLARELQKKIRHKPVRQLISELGDVVTALTPCLLMSPLSVAQFLSADSRLFDLVIFDEASQITVWDAIGAIARGNNVIVVGDPKQMPPTSFFERGAEDDADEGGLSDDLESILDEALAASVKWHRLTGHYRSRHESLIAFSNHRYYNGELVTYPSNETKKSAVSFIRVDGLYQRGKGRTNPDEAKAMVAEVRRRLGNPELSQLSIGVVTLNSEQQRLIDDLLDEARREDPELERFFGDNAEEPLFVKNLETVQGDQRDVILLSVGYGPDTPGARTMSMNFGPLNRKGGERRLNVAITRATTEVVIFASFEPSMIDLTRTSAVAVRDLKHYLEFAERGPVALGEALQSIGRANAYDSDFEEAVAEGLRHRGWTVHTQIGVSKFRIDLGVVHPDYPGRYLAGIECDGATYHSSPSARDRDRVRQVILEQLKWSLVRIWSTDFFIDVAGTLTRADQRLRVMLEADRVSSTNTEKASPEIVSGSIEPDKVIEHRGEYVRDEEDTTEEATPSDKHRLDELEDSALGLDEEDKVAPVGRVPGADGERQIFAKKPTEVATPQLSAERFYDSGYQGTLRTLMFQLIDQQGPITFHHLATQVARLHGFQRTGGQIKRQVWAVVGNKRPRSRTPDQHTILWPQGTSPRNLIDFRGLAPNGRERLWGDVPYPEKLALAVRVMREGPHEDPALVMAAHIGIGRLKAKTREELEGLLRMAERSLDDCTDPAADRTD